MSPTHQELALSDVVEHRTNGVLSSRVRRSIESILASISEGVCGGLNSGNVADRMLSWISISIVQYCKLRSIISWDENRINSSGHHIPNSEQSALISLPSSTTWSRLHKLKGIQIWFTAGQITEHENIDLIIGLKNRRMKNCWRTFHWNIQMGTIKVNLTLAWTFSPFNVDYTLQSPTLCWLTCWQSTAVFMLCSPEIIWWCKCVCVACASNDQEKVVFWMSF